ncbi:hypothetical protein LO80_03445 [Candidatus Francisella endociliophora]|uniref:Uncharacterized protein n=1 Tax=Candidatus Francisella endociliophora TaxID=653937 RepID=A0A097ENH2_9GAMM|nr:hypothetical protein LO80_03445 [Francisella sp. FSC1006]
MIIKMSNIQIYRLSLLLILSMVSLYISPVILFLLLFIGFMATSAFGVFTVISIIFIPIKLLHCLFVPNKDSYKELIDVLCIFIFSTFGTFMVLYFYIRDGKFDGG